MILQKLTGNIWSGIVMLKHSNIDVHVQNDVVLQDLVSISDAHQCICHMRKSCSTIMMGSCPHHDTVDTCIHQHLTGNTEKLSTTWHMSISPSAGTCPYHPLLAHVHITLCWHISISPSAGTCPYHPLLAHVHITLCWHMSISPSAGTCPYHPLLAHVHITLYWHMSISPSAGTCPYHPLLAHVHITLCWHMSISPSAGTTADLH